MSYRSSSDLTAHVAPLIGLHGGRWMLHTETLGHCRDRGYPNGFAYYVVGRGGVLGDVDADVVAAAFGFFAPSLIRTMWEGGASVEGPGNSALRYGEACAEFGRRRLDGFSGADRYCEMAERVIEAVDVTGLSLFAGWKAHPRPDDATGRAYLLTNVLREWRGSVHVAAVAASALSPMEAVLATGGAAQAKQFGWGDEFPEVSETALMARADVERATDAACARAFETAFDSAERAEFAELVDQFVVVFDTAFAALA